MHETQETRYGSIIFAVLLMIGFAFIICRTTQHVKLIKNLVYYIAYPNVAAANNIFCFTGSLAENIKSVVFLDQENISYKQKNRELEDKLRNYDIISKEYDNLSKFLNLEKIENMKSVFAKISVREPSEWYQWLIIDKGEDDGLKEGLPVTIFNKGKNTLCVLGKIIETYRSSAKVILITNSNCEIPVEIKEKGINCLAEGFNANIIKITYIPSDANVEPGDEIVVSELSSVFSKGLPVGVIKEVKEETYIDFKTAIAEVYCESDIVYDAVILVPQEGHI
jgi:rod shape-determining protein MreC